MKGFEIYRSVQRQRDIETKKKGIDRLIGYSREYSSTQVSIRYTGTSLRSARTALKCEAKVIQAFCVLTSVQWINGTVFFFKYLIPVLTTSHPRFPFVDKRVEPLPIPDLSVHRIRPLAFEYNTGNSHDTYPSYIRILQPAELKKVKYPYLQ